MMTFIKLIKNEEKTSMYDNRSLKYVMLSILFQSFSVLIGLITLKFIHSNWIAFVNYYLCLILLNVRFNLPFSWKILNFLLLPASLIQLSFKISPVLYGFIFIVLLCIYFPTIWTGIPYYPTSLITYDAILNELPIDRSFKFIDLGCGYGFLLNYLAFRRPLGKFYGTEISFIPYITAKIYSYFRKNMIVQYKNFWDHSFHEYDYIYAFLAPNPMPNLWTKVKREMKKDALFMVNTFSLTQPEIKKIEINDSRKCILYFYKV